MFGKLTLSIVENDKVIDTVEKETSTELTDLISSLEAFRQIANEKLTQKIEQEEDIKEQEKIVLKDEEKSGNCSPKKRKT